MSTFLNAMSKVLHPVQWEKHASQENYVEPKVQWRAIQTALLAVYEVNWGYFKLP